jgi:hypothetical protein
MKWKVFKYPWRWQLKSSPEELWPYVADTHRFNQATRLPEIEFTEIPLEIGGSRLMARPSKLGIVVEYEDQPFDLAPPSTWPRDWKAKVKAGTWSFLKVYASTRPWPSC